MRVVVCEPHGEAAVAAVHRALPRPFDWVLKRQGSRKWGGQGVFEDSGKKSGGGKVNQDCFM